MDNWCPTKETGSEAKQGVGQRFFHKWLSLCANTREPNNTANTSIICSSKSSLLAFYHLFFTYYSESNNLTLPLKVKTSKKREMIVLPDFQLYQKFISALGGRLEVNFFVSLFMLCKGIELTNPRVRTVPHQLMLSLGQPFFVLSESFSKVGVGGSISTMKNEKWILTCKQL